MESNQKFAIIINRIILSLTPFCSSSGSFKTGKLVYGIFSPPSSGNHEVWDTSWVWLVGPRSQLSGHNGAGRFQLWVELGLAAGSGIQSSDLVGRFQLWVGLGVASDSWIQSSGLVGRFQLWVGLGVASVSGIQSSGLSLAGLTQYKPYSQSMFYALKNIYFSII